MRLLQRQMDYRDIDDRRIIGWLDRQSADMEFHEFFRSRDLQLLKSLASGLERDEYLIRMGQRLEHLMLLEKVDEAHKAALKERQANQTRAAGKEKAQADIVPTSRPANDQITES